MCDSLREDSRTRLHLRPRLLNLCAYASIYKHFVIGYTVYIALNRNYPEPRLATGGSAPISFPASTGRSYRE